MATVSGGGFLFERTSVGGKWYWTVRANNVQGVGQSYQVVDIQTPFGKMTDASIPLPGDVVTAMAESIAEMQSQLSPRVASVTGQPTSYSLTVTEGDPATALTELEFINSGAFGSFMDMSATSSAPWLSPSGPVRGIGKNQTGRISLRVLPQSLLATDSPYTATVYVQDNSPSPNVVPVTVTVTVLPRPTISVASSLVTLTYSLGTQTGESQQLSVTNSGPTGSILSALIAKVQNLSPWLAVSPSSVGPLDSLDSDTIDFTLVPSSVPQIPGTYTEVVAISSRQATISPVNLTVSLTVTA